MPLDLSLYPEEVVSFLISGQAVNDASFISEKYKFGPEGIDKLLDAYESVVAKETSLLNLPDLLEKSFGIEKEIAKKVSADLAGRRLLPIDAYVGDVSGAIISWGGKIEDYPKDRVAVRKMSPEQFVSQIADHSGVKMSDKQLEHRLNFILSSFVRGVRTREQATSAMTRAIKVGGLELDAKVADSLVSQIEKEKSFVNIEDQAMPEQPMVSDNAIVSVTSSKSDELVLEQEKQVREEDEELRAAKIITEAVKVPAISVEDAVTRVTAVCKECSANPEIAKRFSDAVSARMREVRDAFETRDLLERSVGEGGIGLSGRALADALSEIEAEFGRMRASQDQPRSAGKEKYLLQLREHELGRNNIARKEQEVINKRFAALTGTVAEPIAPSAPVGSRVSASMGVLDEQDAHAKKIEPAVLQNAIDKSSVQTASVPVLSAQSIAENIGKRPSVTDVKAPKKLVGPIEELKMMNIERFRRLSSDPKEAGIKILDKIGLLAAESPIRKIEAIRAWGQSELYQSYLSSQKAALFGTDDQSGLIQQEKQAIFELNSELNS